MQPVSLAASISPGCSKMLFVSPVTRIRPLSTMEVFCRICTPHLLWLQGSYRPCNPGENPAFLSGAHLSDIRPAQKKRLIQENSFRFTDHHSGQCHSLLLSTGKLGRIPLFKAFQVIPPDQVCHFLPDGSFSTAMTAADILFHSHCGKKCIILEKIADSSSAASD